MARETYSYMKRPVPTVPDGASIAKDTTSSAAAGAQVGGVYGAIAGAGYGFIKSKMNQEEVKREANLAKSDNNFIEGLNGRYTSGNTYVGLQAKRGIKNTGTETVEMEGGEIHVDKNYNIKANPVNGRSHEEGGIKVSMKPGDTIFNTQDDPNKYKQVMGAIRRFKVKGDTKAKSYLDKLKDDLPDAEDVEKAYTGTTNPLELDDAEKALAKSKEVNKQDESILVDVPVRNSKYEGIIDKNKKLAYSMEAVQPTLYTNATNPDFIDRFKNPNDRFTDYEGSNDVERLQNAAKAHDINYTDLKKELDTKNEWGEGHTNNIKNFGTLVNDWRGKPDEVNIKGINTESNNPYEDITYPSEENNIPTINENIPEEKVAYPELDKYTYNTKSNKYIEKDPEFTSKLEGAGKYASIINNITTGLTPIERANRRFYVPEDSEYKDKSATQRKAVMESRNYQTQALRGKGLSAAQQQSYNSQIGARYIGANEQINNAEAQRFDQVKQFNTGQRNQAGQMNTGFAQQYDQQDLQSEAVRKRYKDVGLSELSTISQFDEQSKYMKSRNKKQDEMDALNFKWMKQQSKDFDWTIDGENTYKGNKVTINGPKRYKMTKDETYIAK